MPNQQDERVFGAVAAVVSLAGWTIKKVSTGDDLKTKTATIAIERISDGQVQAHFDFEREDTTYQVDGTNGHVDSVDHPPTDPADLTETDETQGRLPDADDTEKVAPASDEPREGIEVREGETAELSGEGDPPAEHHLVGEAAAVARRRRAH